ncbi:hypothetical protein R7M47_05040 [Bacillus inaquosorum]|uniref:hypothetical protein n=1 Tax=Bacillus inaquosorum TaxID=483913 RepID=UPI00389A192F
MGVSASPPSVGSVAGGVSLPVSVVGSSPPVSFVGSSVAGGVSVGGSSGVGSAGTVPE